MKPKLLLPPNNPRIFLHLYKLFNPFLILTCIGILYYSLFARHDFNWADEGSVALISQKLAHNEIPYTDIYLGYGLLWFFPITTLFKVFGVKFFLVRTYFLGIGLTSALFTHALLFRLTANLRLAFFTALLVLLMPGCIFQTYISFLVISGLYFLLLFDGASPRPVMNPWLALVFNGLYLGLAYLIRGDIATFFAFLFLFYHGSLSVLSIIHGTNFIKEFIALFQRFVLVFLLVIAVALPFALAAINHGYFDDFLSQYTYLPKSLILKIQQRFFLDSANSATPAGSLLPRISLQSALHGGWPAVVMFFLTYMPIVAFILIGFFIFFDFFPHRSGNIISEGSLKGTGQLLFVLLGAYSTFPQFFVWRPDIPHLAGFSPGFFIVLSYFLFILSSHEGVTRTSKLVKKSIFWIFAFFYMAYTALFYCNSDYLPDFLWKHTVEFKADNRVDVFMPPEKKALLTTLTSTIQNLSAPGEYVLCFPYCPGLNFLADRPTFQKFLYVDDSFLLLFPDWIEEMKEQIHIRRPRIIIVHNWAVNVSDISVFSNWAKPLYDYITQTYELKATIDGQFEIFLLK